MLRNFLMTAWRSMVRQRGFSLLNILGLTLGISSSLFLMLYLFQELGYDQHHVKKDRLYRISSQISEPDNSFKWSVTQNPLGPALNQDYPEVESYVRFVGNDRTLFKYEEAEIYAEEVYIVDSTIFDLFTVEWVYGPANGGLDQPNTIVLARSVAEKFFEKSDPVGKQIETESGESYEITGVYEDMPQQSHIIANVMISGTGFDFMRRTDGWGGFNIYTYVLLEEGASAASFAAKLPEVVEKYVAVIFDQFDISVEYTLLPITDIHLKSDFQGEPQPTGNMSYIYIFAAIGLFMLLIACINYMNLATARAASRAREIGIRKVMGSYRSHLIGQFLSESTLTTLISFVLAMGLVLILLPLVNTWLAVPLAASSLFQPKVLLSTLAIFLVVSLLAGSYPAFFLSAMEPVKTLKGAINRIGGHATLRKGLVVLQFSISLFMLVSTGIVFDQLNFLQEKDLGFTSAPVARFGFPDNNAREKWPVLEQKLEALPGVLAASSSNASPGSGYGKTLWNVENNEGVMEQKGVDNFSVDYDYIPTLEIEIVEGRNFDREIRTDSFAAVLVNEAFVKRMSWEEPIGKRFQFDVSNDTLPYAYVVGVFKNYHHRSLYNLIEPLVLRPRVNNSIVQARLTKENVPTSLAQIEQAWQEVFPTAPFEYEFVDEEFMAQYEADQLRSQIFTVFSILTIIIACLGLLGLAAFTAEQRTKEIGIRKVIGASVQQLVVLLSKDFLILVSLSILLAFPAAWFFMKSWLEGFAYAADMRWTTFAGAFVLTLLISVMTTSYHAIRTARSNPVMALRNE